MSESPHPSNEEVARAIYAFAAQQMRAGKSNVQVQQELEAKGLPPEAARAVIQRLSEVRTRARGNTATRDMVIGGVICLIGIIVTVATYSAASSGGGTYVVAWGAIIFGGWQFLRGLMNQDN